MNNFLRIEQKASQKALQQEMNQKQAYRDRFMFFMLLSFVVLASLIVYIILYAKKRKAYRLLVLQNQQWARNPIDGNPKTAVKEANDKDLQLWNTIKNFVEEHEYYTNDEVSLDSLSKDLGINRTYVSNVINSHEDNFPTFINRYRIQKSINLLSEEHPDSLDNISASVGFKNRKTFYNAFKNLTGLSPSQFKNNLQKASSEEKS
jgi:YesN/AraC family two-component response regulator